MTSVAIVYHSGFGHTKVLAERVAEGVGKVDGVAAVVRSVDDLPAPDNGDYSEAWDALFEAEAIVMGSPTYMGSVSGPFKTFMDRSSAAWGATRWKNKLAGGFTTGGGLSGDKLNSLTTLAIFAAQHSMIWVPTAADPEGAEPEHINRLGSYLGVMAQSGNAPPSETPPEGDRRFAEGYGVRIATLAKTLGPALRA